MITLVIDHKKLYYFFSFSVYFGILPFDIDLCDFVFKDDSSDFASFANDNTLYERGPKLNEVSKNL